MAKWSKRIPILLVGSLLASMLAFAGTAHATTTTCTDPGTGNPTAKEDTYIKQDFPNTNYGTADPLEIQGTTSKKRWSYLKFNCALPAGETVISATLTVKFTKVQSQAVEVHAGGGTSPNGWAENTLTWSLANSTYPPGAILASHTVALGFQDFALGTNVVNGDNTYVFEAPSSGGAANFQFRSRTYGTVAARPKLVVTTQAAQQPPTVTTGSASNITDTTATLNGDANPNGASTDCHFDWGQTTRYGNTTATQDIGSGSSNVPVSANLTGLSPSTTYNFRLSCTNSAGTTNGANAQFTTNATVPPSDLLQRTDLIKASEAGAWETSGTPSADATHGTLAVDAGIKVVRFAVGDCFSTTSPVKPTNTCGSDNHTGTWSRTSFDTAISNIKNNITTPAGGVLWLKMLPIAGDYPTTSIGRSFCPPWTGTIDDTNSNIAAYKDLVYETYQAGYTGRLVIELFNEEYYACTKNLPGQPASGVWDQQAGTELGGGSVGVSERVGDHFAAVAPALKSYARSLGFTQVVLGADFGVPGGISWGQTNWAADASAPWGYRWGNADGTCGTNCFQPRWIDGFNNHVKAVYDANPNADLIPDFEAVHTYVHSLDNYLSAPYESSITGSATEDDKVLYSYFRNWILKSRARVEAIWGATIGDQIRFAFSEGSPGSSNSTGTWGGWTTAGRPGQFLTGWFEMLKGTTYGGNGQMTGPNSTRFWEFTWFCLSCNSDTSADKYYDLIHQDGTTPDWYTDYKNVVIP
jgi:hypothetical protein